VYAGLYSQDTLNEWEPSIKLAVERLPEDVYDQRMFRISRALQLSNLKIQLPRSEWTTFEDVSEGIM
jgi:ubiquinol-cytochrome c reductase subunit 7